MSNAATISNGLIAPAAVTIVGNVVTTLAPTTTFERGCHLAGMRNHLRDMTAGQVRVINGVTVEKLARDAFWVNGCELEALTTKATAALCTPAVA